MLLFSSHVQHGQRPSITPHSDTACCLQERARKLRIFLDEKHPFEGHPDLTEWAPYQRNLHVSAACIARCSDPHFARYCKPAICGHKFALQNKEVPEDLKPGEVLLNPEGYFKSFKHVLSEQQKELVLRQIKDHQDGAERLQASKVIRQNTNNQA